MFGSGRWFDQGKELLRQDAEQKRIERMRRSELLTLPDEVRYLRARVAVLERRLAELEAREQHPVRREDY